MRSENLVFYEAIFAMPVLARRERFYYNKASRMEGKDGMKLLKRMTAILLLLTMIISGAAAEKKEKKKETVTWRSLTVDKDTEYVNLEKRGVNDWENFYAFLAKLPNLKRVDMYNTVINLQVFNRLEKQFPNVQFGVQLRYGKHRLRTDDTAFSTLYSGGDRKHSYDEINMLTWCTNLYALDIGHHPVRKLDFLYKMPELRVLIVALCDVEDITPIASLKHLEYLEIFHNRIKDVSCLKDLKYLMDLDLVQNYVEDLSPLAEIKSLKRLWIYRNIKPDLNSPDEETVKMLQEALPDCYIAARDTSRSKAWVQHPHQQVIQRIFHSKVYEPFEDSDPENMPEPWRSEHLKQTKKKDSKKKK